MGLTGKCAVVTAASRGIGRAIALQLANEGAKVVVNYSGSEQKAQEVVEEIKANGGEAIAVQANVADADSVQNLIKSALDTYGSIDILVNNAGFGVHGAFESTDLEKELQLVQLQIGALVTLTKLVIPGMKRAGK